MDKPKTLLRITQHAFLPSQQKYLRDVYGDYIVVQHNDSVNPGVLRQLQERYKPDVVEIVLPPHLANEALRIFHQADIIRTVMNRTVLPGGRARREFSHYEKIEEIRYESRRL